MLPSLSMPKFSRSLVATLSRVSGIAVGKVMESVTQEPVILKAKRREREGIQSLTESEREFLLRAGDKLRRRRGGM